MSEEANKHKLRRLIEAVEKHFGLTPGHRFRLDGDPFHVEFCDDYQTWKVRCVVGEVCDKDKTMVENVKLNPAYFRKAIAFRPEDSEKGFGLLTIK